MAIRQGDTAGDAIFLADKCSALRVFEDGQGKMNLSLNDAGGSVLVVSQFTLYADAHRGNRPSFSFAARADVAQPLYDLFVERMQKTLGEDRVRTGIFGAMMQVHLVNDGPVTVLLESPGNAGEDSPA
ncbi:MAG TPA: D-aminoacyl-tRNA deacylase [Bacteroidota bacterium]|nr:D-aminoacyl-tRNA deacylase [Bacteroidota bacterium]